jgi:ribulose-bisphosphate carboxylase large chain
MVEGVEAVMVAPSLMGYDVIAWLRDETDLILFAHTSFTLSYTRVQTFGVALDVWVRIQRLLGADVILLPSWGGSFGVAPAETEDCVDACLGDDIEARPAFPAHSGSMNAATVDGLARRTRSRDFILTSGSGLFDHPAGPEAGARALLAVLTDPAYEVGPGSGWVKRWVPA